MKQLNKYTDESTIIHDIKVTTEINELLGVEMATKERYSKILTIRIDPALFEELRKEVESKDMDISEFIRGCLRTGMYLHEMNTALRSRRGDLFD